MSLLALLAGCNPWTAEETVPEDTRPDILDAMPMINPIEEGLPASGPPRTDRSTYYNYAKGEVSYRSKSYPLTSMPGFEVHQYGFDTATLDPSLHDEWKKIFMMTKGTVGYFKKGNFNASLFQGEAAPEDMLLISVDKVHFDKWRDFYPEEAFLMTEYVYMNFDFASLKDHLKPYIKSSISFANHKLAYKAVKGTDYLGAESGDWEEDYYTEVFSAGYGFPIHVPGGRQIGEMANKGSSATQFELGVAYNVDNYNGFELTNFLQYRQRLTGTLVDNCQLAGHPLIFHIAPNAEPDNARVDLVDIANQGKKHGNTLAWDMDSQDNYVIVQKAAPGGLPAGLIPASHGTTTIDIYNPDGVPLWLDGFDAKLSVSTTQFDVSMGIDISLNDQTCPDTRIQVWIATSGWTAQQYVAFEINIVVLDCKVFPVQFWKVNDRVRTLNRVFSFTDLRDEINKLLGPQTGCYVQPYDSGAGTLPTIQTTTVGCSDREGKFRTKLAGGATTSCLDELWDGRDKARTFNAFLVWELRTDSGGTVNQDLHGSTISSTEGGQPVSINLFEMEDEDADGVQRDLAFIAATVVHELGHAFAWNFLFDHGAGTIKPGFEHFDHEKNASGGWTHSNGHHRYAYNIMHDGSTSGELNKFITKEQAEFIQQEISNAT